jgi:hypothetical protein
MKRIILDHFRRWWLVLTVILVAYFAFQAMSIRENNSKTSDDTGIATVHHIINTVDNSFIFQAIMWLGFLLVWDVQRGLSRVLISLPVATRQIGRAWWLAAVALPAIALGIAGLLALLFFSGGNNFVNLLENYLTGWVLASLYLGAAFGALTFTAPMIPDHFTGRIRFIISNWLFAFAIVGILLLQFQTLTLAQTTLMCAAYAVLFILGWFRAETLVMTRAGFRPASQTSGKSAGPSRCSQGRGGLWFLFQTLFIRQILFGLLMMGAFFLIINFVTPHHDLSSQRTLEPFLANSWQFFWVMTFQMIIVSTHIRFLRTLPLPSWKLAAVLVSAPLAAMLGTVICADLIFSAIIGVAPLSPVQMIHHGFSMEMAMFTVFVPLLVWRGYNVSTATWRAPEVIIFLALFAAVLSYIIFGSSFVNNHFSATTTGLISLTMVLGSFLVTRFILEYSSETYRPRTNQFSNWQWGAGR